MGQVLDPQQVDAIKVYPPLGLARVGNAAGDGDFVEDFRLADGAIKRCWRSPPIMPTSTGQWRSPILKRASTNLTRRWTCPTAWASRRRSAIGPIRFKCLAAGECSISCRRRSRSRAERFRE